MPSRRSAATGVSGQMLQSALRRWLNGGDALLGPGQLGRDPLERALYSFEGVTGGPHIHPWQAGSRAGIGYAMEEEGEQRDSSAAGGGLEQGGGGGSAGEAGCEGRASALAQRRQHMWL